MQTILVGYDGSEQSKNALLRAAQIGKPLGSNIIVTSVAPMLITSPRSAGPYDPADPPQHHEDELEEALATSSSRASRLRSSSGTATPQA
jgi:nucleotide-binding universal stress UspA family protein